MLLFFSYIRRIVLSLPKIVSILISLMFMNLLVFTIVNLISMESMNTIFVIVFAPFVVILSITFTFYTIFRIKDEYAQ